MSLVLVGTVEGSRVAFDALVTAGLPPDLVVTLPPEAAHRHSDFVDMTGPAKRIGCPVIHTTNINAPQTLEAISAVDPDLCLVIGWSQICREPFRSIARLGNIGFHPAPLPRLRGRAVIAWTILLGMRETGSTLIWLDEGMDSGDILLQKTFMVDDGETARSLYDKHTAALAEMLPKAVNLASSSSAARIVQDHDQATYCAKRTPDDGLIDWHKPADDILRLVRAVGDPYPGAFTISNGERLWIDTASPCTESHRFIGMSGQVQAYTEDGFIVRCGDKTCLEIGSWHSKSGNRPSMHSKLG